MYRQVVLLAHALLPEEDMGSIQPPRQQLVGKTSRWCELIALDVGPGVSFYELQ